MCSAGRARQDSAGRAGGRRRRFHQLRDKAGAGDLAGIPSIVIFELTERAIQLIKKAIDMPESRVLLKKRQFILKLHHMFLHGISVKNAL
jgi:hypothetical protein